METRRCPICGESLLLSEFGICRARPDGLNLYCKSCIRAKVTASRRALKEYRAARRERLQPSGLEAQRPLLEVRPWLRRQSPLERVREAISGGARTQREIEQAAGLPKGGDEVGEAIADLLLWSREIRSEIVGEERRYYLRAGAQPIESAAYNPAELPARMPDAPAGFSKLRGLMPGKRKAG